MITLQPPIYMLQTSNYVREIELKAVWHMTIKGDLEVSQCSTCLTAMGQRPPFCFSSEVRKHGRINMAAARRFTNSIRVMRT